MGVLKFRILFFFTLIFTIYWSIIDLQCCISFRCTAKWPSYSYAYTHSFVDSFPIKVVKEYCIEFPALYIRSLLIIYSIRSTVCMLIPTPNLSLLPNFPLWKPKVCFWTNSFLLSKIVSKYLCQQGKWKHLFFLRFFLLEDVNGGIGLSRLTTEILFVSLKRKGKLWKWKWSCSVMSDSLRPCGL